MSGLELIKDGQHSISNGQSLGGLQNISALLKAKYNNDLGSFDMNELMDLSLASNSSIQQDLAFNLLDIPTA